jgi:hypothetical protein
MPIAAAILLLVIRTYDVVNVPQRELNTAKHVAGRILQQAGIDVLWIDCGRLSVVPAPDPCVAQPGADELIMRIVTADRYQGGHLAIDALGYSQVDTHAGTGTLATVYSDRSARMAAAAGLDIGTVVGFVMAHEIGHLLMGTNLHQPDGLMRARWTPSALQRRFDRDWQFSRRDIDQLEINLKRRKQNLTMSPAACACPVPCARSTTPLLCP